MFKKIVALGLVGLFLVVSFVVAEDSTGPYNPIADVNRDGTVDIQDLVEVGQAYGSTSLVSIPNQTVISVFNETSPIANARIAIFDYYTPEHSAAQQIGYTNSSGIANFTLSPNENYTVIAWFKADYNYASFDTNSFGEALISIIICNGQKRLPQTCKTFTIFNKTSGELLSGRLVMPMFCNISTYEYIDTAKFVNEDFRGTAIPALTTNGICWIMGEGGSPYYRWETPYSTWGVLIYIDSHLIDEFSVFTTDENGNANIVVYVEG